MRQEPEDQREEPGQKRRRKPAMFIVLLLLLAVVAGATVKLTGRESETAAQVLGASSKTTPAPTITLGPSGPTSSTTATFTYKNSEKGATFMCRLDAGPLTACPSSGIAYQGLSQGTHTFGVAAQGVSLSPTTSRTWVVDTIKPLRPVITEGPEDPTFDTSAGFVFTGETGARFECRLDGAKAEPCTSPFDSKKVGAADHVFRVAAVDAAGNRGDSSEPWSWTVLINKGFGVSGDAAGPLYPGMAATPLNLRISNPYNFSIKVVGIDVSAAGPAGCGAGNLELQSLAADHLTPIVVPANSSQLLSSLLDDPQWQQNWPADWPTIRLKNSSTDNQDTCKSAKFTLSYTGTATKP